MNSNDPNILKIKIFKKNMKFKILFLLVSTVLINKFTKCAGCLISEKETACCGLTAYDPTQYICCDRTLQIKESSNACCGTKAYDTIWKICCGNILLSKESNNACCGRMAYKTENMLRRKFTKQRIK